MKWSVWRQYRDGRENGVWVDETFMSGGIFNTREAAEKKAADCRYYHDAERTYEVRERNDC